MVEDYQNNYGSGWISLYRSIKRNWLWSDPVKLKWWLTILFEVNHSDNKIAIGYSLYNIKAGQSAKSLRTWATEFDTSVKSVVKFFDMLEKDDMIKRETIGKGKQSTTMLTVCNYGTYQKQKGRTETQEHTQEGTQRERKGTHEGGTNNNANNYNNDNNEQETVLTSFNKFWELYGKKLDTVKCQREWSEIDSQEYEKILSHVPKFVKASGEYLCKPLNYLQGRRWQDEQLPNYAEKKEPTQQKLTPYKIQPPRY